MSRVEKIMGCVFGQAVADAVGLQTENMTPKEINEKYPEGVIFPYENQIRGFPVCDWTDDTDQMILIMEVLTSCADKLIPQGDGGANESNSIDSAENVEYSEYNKNLIIDKNSAPRSVPRGVEEPPPAPIEYLGPEHLFAYKLRKWIQEGFPDLGDTIGMGCGALTVNIVSRQGFLKDPILIAELVHKYHKLPFDSAGADAHNITDNDADAFDPPASNGAVMRTAIIGTYPNPQARRITAEMLCRTTHADKRCVASCIMITELVNILTYKVKLNFYLVNKDGTVSSTISADNNADNNAPIRDQRFHIEGHQNILVAIDECSRFASTYITNAEHKNEFRRYCSAELDKIGICEEGKHGYTFKTMACAVWALRELWRACEHSIAEINIGELIEQGIEPSHIPTIYLRNVFNVIITDIVSRGGDADTNASVAGAVLGATLGFGCIPPNWVKALPNTLWLSDKVAKYVGAVRV